MKHKVKVTVLDKKLQPELQQQYLADPESVKTNGDPDTVAGGPKMPFCSEALDAISRYIYTGLQGGSIMQGWTNDDRVMIACCNDGTRPVIFKIGRIDYE